jgi:hypothetical protein
MMIDVLMSGESEGRQLVLPPGRTGARPAEVLSKQLLVADTVFLHVLHTEPALRGLAHAPVPSLQSKASL